MTDETPQPEGEPSPAAPEETPTAETKPFTYDDAIAQAAARRRRGRRRAADSADARQLPWPRPSPPRGPALRSPRHRDRPTGPQASSFPKWVGLVAAAIVAALIFGGIGYAIGDSSDSGTTQNASNVFPNGNANGGQQLPGGGQFPGGASSRTATATATERQRQRQRSNGGGTTEQRRLPRRRRADQHRPQGRRGHRRGRRQPRGQGGPAGRRRDHRHRRQRRHVPDAVRSAIQAKQSGDEISVTYTRQRSVEHPSKVTLTSRSQAHPADRPARTTTREQAFGAV